MKPFNKKFTMLALAGAVAFAGASAASASERTYRITVTNITKGLFFTPTIVASHNQATHFFTVGDPASESLAAMAEGGDIVPLMNDYLENDRVADIQNTAGLLGPGETAVLTMTSEAGSRHFSAGAMLLPSNDFFYGLDSVLLPTSKRRVTYFAQAYDAGSEPNDELCINIPGPQCGGEGVSPDVDGEGYVYPAPGFHGEGDLSVSAYHWQGAVAKITVNLISVSD